MNVNVASNGHTIVIKNSPLGLEQVFYDGREMARKRTMGGAVHVFEVTEDEERVVYELEFAMRWHGLSSFAILRRNGIIIYSNK